jgi:uncharacterized membrane protein YfcA
VDITAIQALALLGTGVAAGIVGVLVSLASLVSYPALLALGLAPVSANVTNTVALVFTAAGAGVGSRDELRGQRETLGQLAIVAALGGGSGAFLLLVLPSRWFELVVPILVAGAAALMLLRPWLARHARFQPHGVTPSAVAAFFATMVYIGYFGAAGGMIAIVVLSGVIDRPLTHINAAKAILGGVANLVAALGFALFGPVRWSFVVPLAVGFFVGGAIGPWIARRLPTGVLRGLIGGCGFAVAVLLAWRAYGGG